MAGDEPRSGIGGAAAVDRELYARIGDGDPLRGRAEFQAAELAAEKKAGWYLRGLPPGLDAAALYSSARLAVYEAAIDFSGLGTFRHYAARQVQYALLETHRSQIGRSAASRLFHAPLSLDTDIEEGSLRSLQLSERSRFEEAAVERVSLAEALARLPEGERRVLVLRYGEGLIWKEVAAQLGVTKGTAHNYARRALSRLRRENGVPE